MLKISDRNQLLIGLFLILLLAATRGHHFASIEHLPSASWAVFFLAGVYISRVVIFPVLLALAAFLDYASITWGGVSSFCVSPAYGLLIPAYGILWYAGRKFASVYKENWQTLIPLALFMVGGAMIAEIISSGGFYYFSGRYADQTFAEFAGRIAKYGPKMLSSLVFYVGCTTVIHAIVVAVKPLSIEDHSPRV